MADEPDLVVKVDPEDGGGSSPPITPSPSIVPDPEPPKKEPAAAVPPAGPIDEFRQQFEDLKKQAEKAQRDRNSAVRRERGERDARVAAERESAVARQQAQESRLSSVEVAIAAAERASEAAKAEILSAQEAGDWARAANASERLADARSDWKLATQERAWLNAQAQQAPAKAAPADPVEAFIAQTSEVSGNWLRAHREWITDPRKNAKLVAAHHDALAEGTAIDSPEYFEHVEHFLGIGEKPEAKAEAPAAKPKKSSPPVVPVGISGSATSGGGNEVHLTQGEAKSATDGTLTWTYDDPSGKKRWKRGDPIGIQEFARRKAAMEQRGEYDKTWTTQ